MAETLKDMIDVDKPRKVLMPLADYQAAVKEKYQNVMQHKPNGIECPNCKAELNDTEPNKVTKTNGPSYTSVGCLKCGYFGIRYIDPDKK